MAESAALAVLENLVHISREDFPSGYVCITAVLPDDLAVTNGDNLQLSADRDQPLTPPALGDRWIDRQETGVLQV